MVSLEAMNLYIGLIHLCLLIIFESLRYYLQHVNLDTAVAKNDLILWNWCGKFIYVKKPLKRNYLKFTVFFCLVQACLYHQPEASSKKLSPSLQNKFLKKRYLLIRSGGPKYLRKTFSTFSKPCAIQNVKVGKNHTLILSVGVFANDWWKSEARVSKNRSRTLPRWHPVRAIVRRSSWSTSGQEAAILAARISSGTKRWSRMSKYIGHSRRCHFLRLGHSFGRPVHAANCTHTYNISLI